MSTQAEPPDTPTSATGQPPEGPFRGQTVAEVGVSASRTLMWEAKAADGRADDLLAYAVAHAAPDAQVYRSADARVVVIDPTGTGLPDAPAELLARPAHAWPFERIQR